MRGRADSKDRAEILVPRIFSDFELTERSFGKPLQPFPKTTVIFQQHKGLSHCSYIEKFFTKCAIMRATMNQGLLDGQAKAAFCFNSLPQFYFLLKASLNLTAVQSRHRAT